MNIAIVGGRDFTDYEMLVEVCDSIIEELNDGTPINIVCGLAKGADTLGKKYGESKGYGILEYPADWDRHGRRAGPIRNEEMAKVSQVIIAFWDGKSSGTKHMISMGSKYKLKVAIAEY